MGGEWTSQPGKYARKRKIQGSLYFDSNPIFFALHGSGD